jgi:hypothetical protein
VSAMPLSTGNVPASAAPLYDRTSGVGCKRCWAARPGDVVSCRRLKLETYGLRRESQATKYLVHLFVKGPRGRFDPVDSLGSSLGNGLENERTGDAPSSVVRIDSNLIDFAPIPCPSEWTFGNMLKHGQDVPNGPGFFLGNPNPSGRSRKKRSVPRGQFWKLRLLEMVRSTLNVKILNGAVQLRQELLITCYGGPYYRHHFLEPLSRPTSL